MAQAYNENVLLLLLLEDLLKCPPIAKFRRIL